MSRYFWVVGGRREGMEKGMDEWEELITEMNQGPGSGVGTR